VPGWRPPTSFRQLVRRFNAQARAGEALPWVVTYDGALVGQLSISGITWGSARMASAGYWVDREVAGRGVIPTALALAVDHCFFTVGLNRIEVNIRPENLASLRVVRKLGFREEGLRERFLHIDGGWRDHLSFALTADEVPGGLLRRWRASRAVN
jgi:[ribosomal protein S5]-alanine N-acetyltransferase